MSKRSGRNLRYSALALLLVGVMAVGLGLGSSSSASVMASSHVAPRDADARERLTGVTVDRELAERMQTTSGPWHVMIELSGQPATVAAAAISGPGKGKLSAAAVDAGRQQRDSNKRAQDTVLQALTNSGASVQVLYSAQNAYNGIAVIAGKQDIAKMRQIAGIKALHHMVPQKLDNWYSVPLIGAPTVWQNYGLTGEGISIGIIDTGIDYIHTNFGGSGNTDEYLIYTDTTPSSVTAAAGVYPNEKVVGGYDFVGDTYNADSTDPGYQPVPMPDDNPMDCNGHGSHVAGTAAGYGVNADGSTYTGPYNNSVPFNTMRIGPGVAPEADLYALRVFGCEGSTDTYVMVDAIDWATDPNGDGDFSDHLDIINMSIGAPWQPGDTPDGQASNNASLIGVQVVTSAGNSDDNYYITGGPGAATWSLSTASSADEVEITDGFRVNPPSEISGTYPASQSVNYDWSNPPVTGTLYYPASNQYGCSAWTGEDLTNISGTIVLVDWRKPEDDIQPCGSAARANNATAAGARGIIMADKTPYLDASIAGNASIPAMYTVKQVGDTLKSVLTAGVPQTETVTLSDEYRNSTTLVTPGQNNTLSSFSSRGPRWGDSALKPDIAAPGQSIFSTAVGTGTEGQTLGGTSMAAPHMAGVMALLREQRPDWSVEELKALVMNTANVSIWSGFNNTGDRVGPGRVGAGRVNVPFAALSEIVAYNAETDGAVSVSFGFVEVLGSATLTKTVEIANKGTSAVVYQLGFSPRTVVPGVSYSFPDGDVVSVPAGGTATFRVRLSATASAMKNTHDPTVAELQQDFPRAWISEHSGLITLTPTGRPDIAGNVLRVPVHAVLRPASNMTTQQSKLVVSGANTTTSLNLVGQGVNTGAGYPTNFTSLVTAMELAATSGPVAPTSPTTTATLQAADLQYVGITSDAPAQGVITDTEIFFGIATYDSWSTPYGPIEFDIFIDTNQDGTDDFLLYNTNFADTDIGVTALLDLNDEDADPVAQDLINYYYANYPPTAEMNNSVMVMPVYAASLGLGVNSRFDYRVEAYNFYYDDDGQTDPSEDWFVDETGVLTYDFANPGLDFTGGNTGIPMYNDLPGNTIPVVYDREAFEANGSLGALLLHHYNTAGNRAQVLAVGAADPTAQACTIRFGDVRPGSTFYEYIQCLACRGVVSGYPDGSFRTGNPITRGQIAKMVSNAAGFTENVSGQTYADVIPSGDPSSFYVYIERLSNRNVMGGYPCGAPNEECDGQNRAFFRPGDNATRGQLAKIVSNAAGFTENVSGQTFADVPPSMSPASFYVFVERLAIRGVMSGYPCGTMPGEPCDSQNRPYFRPNAIVTRGQASKIVSNTFFPNCGTGLPE